MLSTNQSNIKLFKHFITHEKFDLVCDRSYLASLSQSLYMSGYIIAGTILAHLSDKYGRRPLAIYCYIIDIAASISCALSPNIIQYLISRLLVGMATTGRGIAIGGLCKK
jgi:MFS family permease